MKQKIKRPNGIDWVLEKLKHFWTFGLKPVVLVPIHDFKVVGKNIAAFIIIGGLCLLPSLYAWINIYACWDPYSKTGDLPVAIVNNDEGAVFGDKVVNVGDNIVEEMKENKVMNWEFVDDWQANYGLNEGVYYAMIEIPSNFSKRMTSLATATPQKPVIVYRVNEKLNAIAAKITNVAKDKLSANIKSNFVKTVNDEAISLFKDERKAGDLKNVELSDLRTSVRNAQSDIDKLKAHIALENNNAVEFQSYLNTATALMPTMIEQIDSLQNVLQASKSLNTRTIETVESISKDLNEDRLQMQEYNQLNQKLIKELKNINTSSYGLRQDNIATMNQLVSICGELHQVIEYDKQNIKILNENNDYTSLGYLYDNLTFLDILVVQEQNKLKELIPLISKDHSEVAITKSLDAISDLSGEMNWRVQNDAKVFYDKGLPVLRTIANNMNTRLDDTTAVLDATKAVIPQLEIINAFLDASSRLTVHQREKLDDMLGELQEDIGQLSDRLNEISDERFDNLIQLIEDNPEEITDFLASPLEVIEQDVYDVKTFGVGLTPFYTVLAIWVGSLLLCAMLAVECGNTVYGYKLNLIQKHFGKMIFFIILSLIQSTIITVGDVYVLGVHPADFGLMLKFSFLSSLAFTTLIFTLVSLLGNVGKAVAVVIMVFQIAGSGGIYPIQTNPEIFGKLLPLWPFTYAINGFREAIAGPVWPAVDANIRALWTIIAISLALVILKKPLHALNMFFEHKFKESQL